MKISQQNCNWLSESNKRAFAKAGPLFSCAVSFLFSVSARNPLTRFGQYCRNRKRDEHFPLGCVYRGSGVCLCALYLHSAICTLQWMVVFCASKHHRVCVRTCKKLLKWRYFFSFIYRFIYRKHWNSVENGVGGKKLLLIVPSLLYQKVSNSPNMSHTEK